LGYLGIGISTPIPFLTIVTAPQLTVEN